MKLQFIDINFIDAPKWDEAKHPRGKSGEHGGQFVKKGMGGGAPPAPQMAKVNIAKWVESHLNAGTPLHEIAAKLPDATKEHTNKDYVNKIKGQIEKKHGLPKGSLSGKGGGGWSQAKPIPKPTPTPMPKPSPVTPPTPQPSPWPGYKADLSDASWYDANEHWITNIDTVKAAAGVPPLVKAHRIKLIAKKHAGANSFGYAKLALEKMEQDHGVPKGTYNTPGWQTAGAAPAKLTPIDPATLPAPYDTPHQKALHAIAADPNKTPEDKIKEITNYPTVVNYPDQHSAKYAESLVTALGGTWQPVQKTPTPSYTPTPPTPTPAVMSTPAILKPLKPTKQWVKDQETFNKATSAVNDHWDSKDAAKHFKSAEPGEFDKYTPAVRAAITSYTGAGSGSMNDYLRDPKTQITPKLQSQIHEIYEAFDEPMSETKNDVKVWRGTNLSKTEFNKWKAGLNTGMPTKPTLDGFSSCSFYSDHPAFSHMPYWLEICVKKGVPTIAAAKGSGHSEGEILLQHGQQYQVLEIEENYKTKGHGTKTRIRLITI